MSNCIEYNDKLVFHPGYYIKEVIDDCGLSQRDFAYKLGTTPKNISDIVNGQQSISVDIASKLARMLGTSIKYWLNLQNEYDSLLIEKKYDEELKKEKEILKDLGYKYFNDYFGLPSLKGEVNKQVECVRQFLKISSLTVLEDRDLSCSFRSSKSLSKSNIIKANAMIQIAINQMQEKDFQKFSKKEFEKKIEYALTQTINKTKYLDNIKELFLKAGVVLEVLPNIQGSNINGACKKIGNGVLLLVVDKRNNVDTFWFTLFHEIGHIVNDDFGVSFVEDMGQKETIANQYASDMLIPTKAYNSFIKEKDFSIEAIKRFSKEINRDPSIVVGRLQNDKYVRYDSKNLNELKKKN